MTDRATLERELAALTAAYFRREIGILMHQAEHWAANGKPMAVHHRVFKADMYFQVVALMERSDPFGMMRAALEAPTINPPGAYPPSRDLHRYRDPSFVARERKFPIMRGPDIPWSVIEPCEDQARRNHGQDLEQLARRGGLTTLEAIAVLTGRACHDIPPAGKAHDRTRELLEIVAERVMIATGNAFVQPLLADRARLDWLDQVNRRMNERTGSHYGWRYHVNHNRAAVLSDCHVPAKSIREAIDAAREKAPPAEELDAGALHHALRQAVKTLTATFVDAEGRCRAPLGNGVVCDIEGRRGAHLPCCPIAVAEAALHPAVTTERAEGESA